MSVVHDDRIWATTAEDGANKVQCIPDVINEYWLAVERFGECLGVIRCHAMTTNVIQCHINILPEHRQHSKQIGQLAIEWIRENTEHQKIYTQVPAICENVIKYLVSFGFNEEGEIKNYWLKGGKLHSVTILTKDL
ncbi:MAG: hypothetical protein CL867_09675 [Cytophagaceae bacterium]|nr:hypothetical protein [Cytophagaceae bacterium]